MQLLTNVLMSNSDLQQNIICIFWIHTYTYLVPTYSSRLHIPRANVLVTFPRTM